MLCKNDYVNYQTHGICKIEDIRPIQFDARSAAQEYYVLRSIGHDKSCIFVPADNPKLMARMRPILSADEIDRIILSVKDQNLLWVDDRKERSALFQDILSRRDERELLLLVSCLYAKSKECPRGLSSTDAQILKKAESVIEQEFSFSLHISPDKIGDYIRAKLGHTTQIGA